MEHTSAKENSLGDPGQRNSTGYNAFVAKILRVMLRPGKFLKVCPLSFGAREIIKEKWK